MSRSRGSVMVTKGPWHAPCCTADPVLTIASAPRPPRPQRTPTPPTPPPKAPRAPPPPRGPPGAAGRAAGAHGRSTINGRRPRRARSPSPAERRSRCSEDLPYFSPRHDPLPSRTPSPLHMAAAFPPSCASSGWSSVRPMISRLRQQRSRWTPPVPDVDVAIVGARCAGASLAMLLSRAGLNVVLIDRGKLPSDKPDSTHLVHPPAIRRLREWGLLAHLEESTRAPRIRQYGLRDIGFDLMADLPPDEDIGFALAPRRWSLDGILLQAALDAGTELIDETSVVDLVTTESNRVAGVRLKARGLPETMIRARLVVGADGTRSTVAHLVGARKYWEKPVRLRSVWTYWPDLGIRNVPTWRDQANYVFAWPTNEGVTLLGTAWKAAEFPSRERQQDAYFEVLARLAPEIRNRIEGVAPQARWMSGSVPNFFRESQGPGWALVGDAGYSRDPATASGITDAIRAADLLAESIMAWLGGAEPEGSALRSYQAGRDRISRPFYEYTCDFARLTPYADDVNEFLRIAVEHPVHSRNLTGLFAQTTDPMEFFSLENVLDVLRGAPSVRHWRLRALASVAGRDGAGYRRRLGGKLLNSRLGELGQYLAMTPSP